ncbi:class I SAM-dependent methyltransferase [Exiguobacterium aurantiacum]|uniref:Tellurite resistance protein TehB n=2 Tax=Exiguobacterium TaxID=33986 RepID=A0A377FWP3_9BACL|nr:class I SAM-dependent methyltransferase [Exiguobacterium aurantiacum]STO09231.1 tellurite resistance protein TehB [Exiguobacterium aurantiacum]
MSWDERFDTEEYVYGEQPNEFLRSQRHLLSDGMQALAIAEGEVRNAVWLAEQGLDVEMWDYSRVGLEKAERLALRRGVSLTTHLVDLAVADWPAQSFDVIVCIFGHFPKDVQTAVLKGVTRALRPGGFFITEVYSEAQLEFGTGGPKDKALLYTTDAFSVLSDSLETRHFFDGIVERQEGRLHQGPSAVIQYVGQKRAESRDM